MFQTFGNVGMSFKTLEEFSFILFPCCSLLNRDVSNNTQDNIIYPPLRLHHTHVTKTQLIMLSSTSRERERTPEEKPKRPPATFCCHCQDVSVASMLQTSVTLAFQRLHSVMCRVAKRSCSYMACESVALKGKTLEKSSLFQINKTKDVKKKRNNLSDRFKSHV